MGEEGRRSQCMVCWVCRPCHGMMMLRLVVGGTDYGFAGALADSLVGGRGCGFVDGLGEGSFGMGRESCRSLDLGEDSAVAAVDSHLGAVRSCPVGSVAAGNHRVVLADSHPVDNPAGNHPGGRSQVVGYIRIRSSFR